LSISVARAAHEPIIPPGGFVSPRTDATDLKTEPDGIPSSLAADVGGIGANRDHPGRYFFATMFDGHAPDQSARKFG